MPSENAASVSIIKSMKHLFKNISLFCCMLACLMMVSGCSDENDLDKQNSNFGYFQIKLRKQIQTFAITNGAELENLNDAKKIQVDLLYNNKTLSQTLNLEAVNAEAAELGLTSESIELLAGNYTLTGYKIFGEFIEGVTEGDKAPVLQEGEPNEPLHFEIVASQMKVVAVDIVAQSRGKLSLLLDKDFSNIQPSTKTAGYDPAAFRYDDIAKVQLDLKAGSNGAMRQYEFKTRRKKTDYLFHTDTVSLRADDYRMVQMRLFDKLNNLILVVEKPHQFLIENATLNRDSVSIDMPMTPAFNDYIALYNIWKKMDGENWYWIGNGFNRGANFLFEYSDGTPRPLDMWGAQPGVVLGASGRIESLNLGGFNAKGMVPDEIGQLTALRTLYLGNHADEGSIDAMEGMASLDRFALEVKGVDIFSNRMEIAKEQLSIRHARKASSLYTSENNAKPFKYVTYTEIGISSHSNRITGLSDAIANCKELSYLSVANGLVTDLPMVLADLENLTDLEIYQCPMDDLPAFVPKMKNLVSFNFSFNKRLDDAKVKESLRKLFDGPSKGTMQLLYLTDNNLKELPDNLSNMTNLGLLDLANNRLTSVPMLGQDVALIQCFLDNNLLTEIPENWFFTDDLEKLSVHNNKITMFPNMFNAKSLYTAEKVDFSGNRIHKMPENFRGIRTETLNLNDNKFDHLPEEFAKSESFFNFLQISNNGIDTIKIEALNNLPYLKAFECMGNNLRYLPVDLDARTLPSLTAVDFSFNSFSRFPIEILNVSLLTELRMTGQLDKITGKKILSQWPLGIDQHPSLRILDVAANDIRNVQNFPMQLNMLNIHDNPNIYISVPTLIRYRIIDGSFKLIFDEDQNVEGI